MNMELKRTVNYWKRIDRRRHSHQRFAERRMISALHRQIRDVLEVLPEGVANTISHLDDLIGTQPIQDAYFDIYRRVGSDFAESSFDGLKSTGKRQFKQEDEGMRSVWMEHMDRFVRYEAGERIQSVTRTTVRRVRGVLENGVTAGLGIEEIARNLQRNNVVNLVRGRVIARTEIVSASNAGAMMGAKSTGLTLEKEWISTAGARTREDHVEADGQTTEMNGSFIVGGEEADYPGDPKLSAENSIQCRCTVAFIPL